MTHSKRAPSFTCSSIRMAQALLLLSVTACGAATYDETQETAELRTANIPGCNYEVSAYYLFAHCGTRGEYTQYVSSDSPKRCPPLTYVTHSLGSGWAKSYEGMANRAPM